MNNLNKNMLRYALKNKFSLSGLFVLFSICMTSLTSLGMLSTNFSGTYNQVVLNGNQHNIVTNELYLSSEDGQINKNKLLEELTSQQAKDAGLNVRRFEGLAIQSSPDAQSKVIRYEPNYPSQYDSNGNKIIPKLNENTLPTDNLQVFIQTGLPYLEAEYAGKIQKFYHLPKSIDLTYIINEVTRTYNIDLGNVPYKNLTDEQKNILKARQTVLYFLAKGENTSKEYGELLNLVYQQNNDTPVDTVDPKKSDKTTKKFDQFFNSANDNYNAPIITGSSVNFTEKNLLAPNVVRFEDYTSRVCIVPPALLKYQNKKVYNYDQFVLECSKTNSNKIYTENSIGLPEFENYIKSIPDEYKVKVDSVDYLIVGAGITPDFFYPIVSLENAVVNFSNEMTIYTNNNGFDRTQYSFQSAPLESLLLIKYSGNDINGMIKKINARAEKYLAFPAGTVNTFAANDTANIFSPTAARVEFIEKLVTTVNAITVILSIFLTIITLFVVVIILNKFISENKKTLYVLVAQGISKQKAVTSIILLPLIPCILGAIFSYTLSFFTQGSIFNLFSAYWPLQTYTQAFNIGIMIALFVGFYAITALVSYLIGLFSLKGSVSSGMNVSPSKLGPLAIQVKKPFAKCNVVTKFRVSLAFGSFSKLLFLSIATSLFMFTLSFIGSSYTSFDNSLATMTKTNTSTMYTNLATPTRNGGQYYAATFDQHGQTFANPKNPNQILNEPYFTNADYNKYYKNPSGNQVPLFKKWADLLYMSINDLGNQENQLRFLGDITNWEFIGNFTFGGPLGTNPWTTVTAPLLPTNQRNASNKIYKELLAKLFSDNRIIKTDETNGISKKAFDKNGIFDKSYLEPLKSFYIVNNSYVNNFVKDENGIYQVIKLENDNDLSSFTKEYVNENVLSKYGQVFQNQNNVVENLEFNQNEPNILKVNINSNTKIQVITPRGIFTKLFDINNPKATFPLYDEITGETIKYLTPDGGTTVISKKYLNFAFYILENPDYRNYIYKNSYNEAVIGSKDETYTYVNASITNPYTGKEYNSFNTKYPYNKEFDIIGVQKNSNFIKLHNQDGNLINNKLFEFKTKVLNDGKENEFPIIPNLYSKKLFNLNVGDKITIFATNNVDRYNPKFLNETIDNNGVKEPNQLNEAYQKAYTRTFKVIDFADSTKEVEFYTTMDAAQKTVGLSYVDTNNELALEDNEYQKVLQKTYQTLDQKYNLINQHNRMGGFNGVFVGDNLIGITNSITLYSPSGLYPGAPEFSNSSKVIRNLINNVLFINKNPKDIEMLGNALYYDNESIDKLNKFLPTLTTTQQQDQATNYFIDELAKIYRKTIYFSMIDKPGSVQALVSTFSNLTKLINNVEVVIVVLVSFLSIIVLIVTSWIIIKDLTQLIVLLKVQGVSDWENTLNILSVFIPTWILSGIVTLPILYGILTLFQEMIFKSMNIIVFASINWWAFFLIFIGVGAFLSLILWFANRYIKKINLIESLKW